MGGPSWDKANHAAVGRVLFLPAWGEWLGTSADILEYFLWIVGSKGRLTSPNSSLGMKMALKKIGQE